MKICCVSSHHNRLGGSQLRLEQDNTFGKFLVEVYPVHVPLVVETPVMRIF